MEVTFGTASAIAAEIPDAPHTMPGALGARCRIIIADDHTLMREGLRALLVSEPELQVIGTADNGRDAVRLVVSHKPDLVLMDLAMPHMDGMSAIRELRRRGFKAPILVITMHKTEEHIRAALQAGASGYLLKDATREEVLAAILAVTAAKTYISPAVADRIVSRYLDHESGEGGAVVRSVSDTLTVREKQVLKLIAEGRRNREIAGDLYVSVKTVEKHRANLMRKLDLHNTAALTSYAIQNSLVAR